MTLTEFLLARIAEDEAAARAAIQPEELYPWGDRQLPQRSPDNFSEDIAGYLGGTWGDHCAIWSPLRVLAECEAKRRIVAEAKAAEDAGEAALYTAGEDARWFTYESVLGLLALPYADHPDYDENWRP